MIILNRTICVECVVKGLLRFIQSLNTLDRMEHERRIIDILSI